MNCWVRVKSKIEIERFSNLRGRLMSPSLIHRWRKGQQIRKEGKKHYGHTFWEIETTDSHYTSWVQCLEKPSNKIKSFQQYLNNEQNLMHECSVQILR